MLFIVVFIVRLSDTGDVLQALSSAAIGGLCALLIMVGFTLLVYLVTMVMGVGSKDDDFKGVKFRKGRDEEYVEYEEIIEED